MVEKPINQQIFEQLSILRISLANHMAAQVHTDQQTASMYRLLISGNGKPSLAETVRKHEEWIQERNIENSRIKQEHQDDVLIKTSDAKKDRSETKREKFQIWLMLGTQVAGFIFLAVEISLHMK
jgi:hypothetical protein